MEFYFIEKIRDFFGVVFVPSKARYKNNAKKVEVEVEVYK